MVSLGLVKVSLGLVNVWDTLGLGLTRIYEGHLCSDATKNYGSPKLLLLQ